MNKIFNYYKLLQYNIVLRNDNNKKNKIIYELYNEISKLEIKYNKLLNEKK